MDKFFGLIVMAVFVEAVITYFSELVKNWSWTLFASVLLGVVVAVMYSLDIPATLGVVASYPLVGQVLTGIVLARGSNYIYDLIGRFTNLYETPADDTDN